MSRPWTEGKWEIYDEPDANQHHPFYGYNVIAPNGKTVVTSTFQYNDAQLIALAPELAEAILKFCDTYETDQWFQDVAVKLRQIGANNE